MALLQSENAKGINLFYMSTLVWDLSHFHFLLLYDKSNSAWLDKISDDLAQSAALEKLIGGYSRQSLQGCSSLRDTFFALRSSALCKCPSFPFVASHRSQNPGSLFSRGFHPSLLVHLPLAASSTDTSVTLEWRRSWSPSLSSR